MTDRPDPFDDLEFETATPDEAEAIVAEVTPAATPEAVPASKAEPAPKAEPVEAAAEAPAPRASSNVIGYATLALSGLAFAGTVAAVVVTLASRPTEPKVSPEHAAIGRIEALLSSQQARLGKIMSATAVQPAAAPQIDPAQLAALGAAVHANQDAIDKLPGLLSQQISRLPRGAASAAPARPVVITKAVSAPGGAQVAEVLRSQAVIQRQLDAIAAKLAKTTAACVTQNDGTIRYP